MEWEGRATELCGVWRVKLTYSLVRTQVDYALSHGFLHWQEGLAVPRDNQSQVSVWCISRYENTVSLYTKNIVPRFSLCDLNNNVFEVDWTKEWWMLLIILSFYSNTDGSLNECKGVPWWRYPPVRLFIVPQFSHFDLIAQNCTAENYNPSLPTKYLSWASWMIYSNI